MAKRKTKVIFPDMNSLSEKFGELFGISGEAQEFFCPGRVNLIGEPIDYLGGLVMPAAISLGIKALVKPNDSKQIRLHSSDFDGIEVFDLETLPILKQGKWSDFVLGVLLQIDKSNAFGLDIIFESSLPKASGLSSSAALEVLSYYIFSSFWLNEEINRTQMAKSCQEIENHFIGVECGIMDQFAVAQGKAGNAIKLRCDNLDFEYVPVDLKEHSLVIINSNKSRELAGSAYNQRLKECKDAITEIRKHREIDSLINATDEDLQLLSNDVLKKRTKHAFSEQKRVLSAAKALKKNNIKKFGEILNTSHQSLKLDYEVSCTELDFIAESLSSSPYCLGARMTGAGFGGCCIALIETSKESELRNQLKDTYSKTFGINLSWYNCNISDGVRTVA